MEYYSAIKKGSFAICDNMMDFEGIMLSKIGHTKKDNYHMISYMWNAKKKRKPNNEKQPGLTETEDKTSGCQRKGGGWGVEDGQNG